MFPYNAQIQAYEAEKVSLSNAIRDDLYGKRQANRDRLKGKLQKTLRVNDNHFIPQGSMAVQTTIQEANGDYDIDDGVWFYEEDLQKDIGGLKVPTSAIATQEMVRDALDHPNFKKRPKVHGNCVRVFYNEGLVVVLIRNFGLG